MRMRRLRELLRIPLLIIPIHVFSAAAAVVIALRTSCSEALTEDEEDA
jgi:hypothetical protein